MKNNKWIFAILAFVIVAFTLINIGATVNTVVQDHPEHLKTLFVATSLMYFPIGAGLIAISYFVKYIMERKQNENVSWHIINLIRAFLGICIVLIQPFKKSIPNCYDLSARIVGGIIVALFAAELVMWLVSLGKKKA